MNANLKPRRRKLLRDRSKSNAKSNIPTLSTSIFIQSRQMRSRKPWVPSTREWNKRRKSISSTFSPKTLPCSKDSTPKSPSTNSYSPKTNKTDKSGKANRREENSKDAHLHTSIGPRHLTMNTTNIENLTLWKERGLFRVILLRIRLKLWPYNRSFDIIELLLFNNIIHKNGVCTHCLHLKLTHPSHSTPRPSRPHLLLGQRGSQSIVDFMGSKGAL